MWLANRIAAEVRKAIYDELGYTASAGISHNKTVAKIACTYNKPNGQTVVPERYVKQALAQVPDRLAKKRYDYVVGSWFLHCVTKS